MAGRLARRAGVVALVTAVALGFAVRAEAAPAAGLPAYDHVVVLVLENEGFTSTFGAASPAHYLNGTLVPQATLDDQYFATGHVSLDNYIAMTSGQPANPLTSTDCATVNLFTCVQAQSAMAGGRNLADQLETAGRSWTGYMDSMPGACFHADYSPTARPPDPYQGDSQAAPAKDYADRHNPFIYYPDLVSDSARCTAHVLPYTQLATDIAQNAVPSFAFITPDTCHDGHDATCSNGSPGGLVAADAWLESNVPPLLSYLNGHNGLLVITFDEAGASDASGCCHGGPGGAPGFGGRVGLLAIGPGVTPGRVVHTAYDHASLLRTVEDLFGIGEHLNNAAASAPMSDLFAAPGTVVPEAPLAALLPLGGAGLAALLLRRRSAARSHPS